MGFLLQWGRVNDVSVKGLDIVITIISEGSGAILFGARGTGAGNLLVALPLAMTLPVMVFAAEKLRPSGKLPPAVFMLCGGWGTCYLLYSAVISRALLGYHGFGFGVCLLGFTLIGIGGALRWPDANRECDRLLFEARRTQGESSRHRPPKTFFTQLVALLVPPPIFVWPLPRKTALGALPPCTLLIIVANILCYAFCNFRADFYTEIVPAFAFNGADFKITALLTSQFLHFGAIHLLVNMLVLLIVGIELERVVGWRLCLAYYLLGGALANLVLGMAMQGVAIASAGASGSIAALMGLMLITMPGRTIRLWFFQIITHRVIAFRAGWVLSAYLVLQTVMAILQSADEIRSGIGYWNHIGGMLYGMAAALLICERVRRRLEPDDLDTRGLAVPFIAAAGAVIAGMVGLACLVSG